MSDSRATKRAAHEGSRRVESERHIERSCTNVKMIGAQKDSHSSWTSSRGAGQWLFGEQTNSTISGLAPRRWLYLRIIGVPL